MLDFRNLCMRAIVPPHSKFRVNRTIWSRVIAKNDYQYGVRPQSWIWEFLNFCHVSVALVKICVYIPDVVEIGGLAAEITIFKMVAVLHVGFSKSDISSWNLCMRAIVPPYSKFRHNRTIWSRVIAKKWFSIWRPSANLVWEFLKFFSRFHRLGQNLRPHAKVRHIPTIRSWDMEI